MCQLLFVNLHKRRMNYLATHVFGNSAGVINDDGFGIFSPGGSLFKVGMGIGDITNVGTLLRHYVPDDSPILAHMRWASAGIPITDENAHPFEGKRFILAHNGRLYGKDEVVTYNQSHQDDNRSLGSDSQRFLETLEKCAKKKDDVPFVDLVKEAMKEFKGKFAFLIYDKVQAKFFAVRGKTADLCITYLYKGLENSEVEDKVEDNIGYVIMTKESDVKEASTNTARLLQTVYEANVHFSKPITLKIETIYELLPKSVEEVGSIAENPTYVYTPPKQAAAKSGKSSFTNNIGFRPFAKDPVFKNVLRIMKFLDENFLSVADLDAILMRILGFGLSDCGAEDFEFFADHMVPVLAGSRRMRKIIQAHNIIIFPHSALMKKFPTLAFPWTLTEDTRVISDALAYFKENMAKK